MQTEAGGLRPELGSRGWAAAGDTGPRGAGARGSHSAVLEPGKACLSLKPQTWRPSGYRSGGAAQGRERGGGRAGGVVPKDSRATLVPRV